MEKPLVSVIMPVYNAEEYLEEAVDSVIASNYSPLELILVDDGSADRSYHLAQQLAEKADAFRDSGLFPLSLHRQQQFVLTVEPFHQLLHPALEVVCVGFYLCSVYVNVVEVNIFHRKNVTVDIRKDLIYFSI